MKIDDEYSKDGGIKVIFIYKWFVDDTRSKTRFITNISTLVYLSQRSKYR